MAIKGLVFSFLLGMLLTAQLHAADENQSCRVHEVCKVVTYQPEVRTSVGLLLDMVAIDSADSVSLADKQNVLRAIQQSDSDSVVDALPKSVRTSSFLRMVNVQVDLSNEGAVQGNLVDCRVTSLSGRPIKSGFLLPTKIKANGPASDKVYAIARGFVQTKESAHSGMIASGCHLLNDVTRKIHRDGKIVLIVGKEYSSFRVTEEIAAVTQDHLRTPAVALDDRHIEITVPKVYASSRSDFTAQVLGLRFSVEPAIVAEGAGKTAVR